MSMAEGTEPGTTANWGLQNVEEPAMLHALKPLLDHPANFRSLARGASERAFLAEKLRTLHAFAAKANLLVYEVRCLESLMGLGALTQSERLRLAYLWASLKPPRAGFSAASLYAEYVIRSGSAQARYEGHELVSSALDKLLEEDPSWARLVLIQQERFR